ncbi:MAG: DNA polymerase III subunit delta' [Alphaproteobacteria bacterium]|nr:MAG: DNA polymerase III subunit delta' [Alphaproteobacteria bacterium]
MAADDAVPTSFDALDGIPDPRENRRLMGHDATLDRLAGLYARGRLHHALLLSGPRGIGKATLACRFAGHLLRFPDASQAPASYVVPAAEDATEGRIASGSHPNLLHLRRPWDHERKRFKTVLSVDEVRRTITFFGTSAGDRGWRVCIVDTADDLHPSAANALLKVLEEPPPRTLFFVLAHSPRGLLATIRSRCQKMDIRPLAQAQVSAALEALGVAGEIAANDRELVAALAEGSVRRAILLARADGIDLYRRFLTLAGNAARPDWSAIHRLASEISATGQDDRYRLFLGLVHDVIARRLRGVPEPGAGPGPGGAEGTSVLARWVEVWEKTRHCAGLADAYNLDRKQVILNLFEAMREAA